MLKYNRQFAKLIRASSFQIRLQQTQTNPRTQTGPHGSDVQPVFRKAVAFGNKVALRDIAGNYMYSNLFLSAKELCKEISKELKGKTNHQIMFLCPNDANYVITQWAIWMSGNTAVPTSSLNPQELLEYFAGDCDCKLIITTPNHADLMHKVSKSLNTNLYVLDSELQKNAMQSMLVSQEELEDGQAAGFYNKRNAMILYTSGTTSKPKGVVLTHKNIISQITTLANAWRWTSDDVILHVLPLHHVHGIVNALLCPLYVGAKCAMLPKYDSNTVWSWLLSVNAAPSDRKITVFMAVPTIYTKLIEEYDNVFKKDSKMAEYIKTTLKSKLRLMVSGSAPLPKNVWERWLDITGHKLLERYGMTEIGMCLSQQYNSLRKPGNVGIPLPGVTVKLGKPPEEDEGDFTTLLEAKNKCGEVKVNLNHNIDSTQNPVGEILVKCDSVFKEYYNMPKATQDAFTTGLWFKTGDIGEYSLENKVFKILGRLNVDIIKSGGYKISALEIETKLLDHPDIADCAVVGVQDEKWGERIAAIVVLKPEKEITLDTLQTWAKSKMAKYHIPKSLQIVETIPKNAMGKVNKKELIKQLF